MKWLLTLVSIILTVIALELGLRFSGYTSKEIYWSWAVDGRLYNIDSRLIYKQVANYMNAEQGVYTDKNGYKIHDNQQHFQVNAKRVAVVGDSVVWGNTPMNGTYPYLLQELITQQTKQRYIVTNAGISGYGTDQQYLFIKDDVIPEVSPEIIVWNVNINDITDNIHRPLFDLKDEKLHFIPGWKHSIYLQGLVLNILGHSPLKHTLLANLILHSLEHVEFFRISTNPEQATHWSLQKMTVLFREMKKLCNEKQIELVFVISPSQRYIEKLEGWEDDEKLIVGIKDVLKGEKVVDTNQVLTAQQDKVLGISTDVETIFLDESVLFPRGYWHPSAKGNLIMAESVTQSLLQE